MTGERRDESVQFSLTELMRLEDERVERERRDREAAEAAARAAKAKAERDEREARERAEAERKERERLLRVEEEARREAMSRAAVEQARIAVEARARAEEAERERRHEIELAKLKTEVQKPQGAGLLVGSGVLGAAVAFVVCTVAYFGAIKPAQARTVEALELAVHQAEGKAADAARAGLEQDRRIAQLEREVRAANDELAQLRAASTTKTPKAAPGPQPVGPRTNAPSTVSTAAIDKCAGSADPLCGLDLRRAK